MSAARLIATGFGLGYIPVAPGTWASLAAVAVGVLIHGLGSFPLLLLATLAVIAVAWWAINTALPEMGGGDPSEIVIDEVAGQWLALLAPSFGFWMMGLDSWRFPYPGWLGAFLAFRLFDIWKPWLVGRADGRGDAWGVLLDDLLAGIFAGILVMILAALAHGVLMR